MLPPPRDCDRDESRSGATVRMDGKARRVGRTRARRPGWATRFCSASPRGERRPHEAFVAVSRHFGRRRRHRPAGASHQVAAVQRGDRRHRQRRAHRGHRRGLERHRADARGHRRARHRIGGRAAARCARPRDRAGWRAGLQRQHLPARLELLAHAGARGRREDQRPDERRGGLRGPAGGPDRAHRGCAGRRARSMARTR